MKKITLRILSLAMLLSLVVTAVPAIAAAARTVIVETLYTGTGSYEMNIKNWSWTEKVIFVKSSNPSVLEVTDAEDLELTPRKAGKAKITVKYKLAGKSYKIKGTYTVKAYPKAVKSLTVNGRKVKLTGEQKRRCVLEALEGEKVSFAINLKPGTGWKIAKINAYTQNTWDSKSKKTALKVANNTKFTVPKDKEAFITYTLAKGKARYQYHFIIERYGE